MSLARTGIGLAALLTCLVGASSTQAAPLADADPANDTPMGAQGPIGPDGWLIKRATSNDDDYGYINLKAGQLVTFKFRAQSGCGGYAGDVEARLSDFADANGISRRDNFMLQAAANGSGDLIWTTPDDPITVRIRTGVDLIGIGCQALFTVVPASAILQGPLPAPEPRNTTAVLPSDVVASVPFTATATGNSYGGDTLSTWVTASTCGSVPSKSSSTSPAVALTKGPFSQPVSSTSAEPGIYLLCLGLHSTTLSGLPDRVDSVPLRVRKPNATGSIALPNNGWFAKTGGTTTATVTINAEIPRRFFLTLSNANGTCGTRWIDDDSVYSTLIGDGSSTGKTLTAGAQTITSEISVPSSAGTYNVCGYVQGSATSPEADAVFQTTLRSGQRRPVPTATIASSAIRMPRFDKPTVTVRCANASTDTCRVFLTLKRGDTTIGTARGVITGGQSRRLSFAVSSATKRLVQRRRSVRISVSGTSANNAGEVRTIRAKTIQLRKPR